MHSLRSKITLLTIIAILVCVSGIGLVSILSIQRTADRISTQYMNELCLETSGEMNHFLDAIDQEVNIAAHYLTDDVSAVVLAEAGVVGAVGTGTSLEGRNYDSPQQQELDAFLHQHVEDAKSLMHSVSYNSTNSLSYYYRINPELSRKEPGFLFVRKGIADFEESTPSDILSFSSDDATHVGWYYQALDKGRPSWLTPYADENLGNVVTSYIAPVYKAGTFVGFVGMDISYESLVAKVENLEIYDTGYAFLTDEFGRIVYHPTIPAGTMLSEVNTELQANEEYMTENEESSTLVGYSIGGVSKRAAWRTLSNGLRLFVSAPVSEIEASWHALIVLILVVGAVLLVVFFIVTAIVMRRITNPLKELTNASQEIANGNYDVELPYEGKDEVGTLTRSFRHLTEHLKVYVSDLNSKAYKDALTNVKNKAAMDMYAGQIDRSEEEKRVYAVILFDCNDLKVINDKYGHDKGDIYLKNSSEIICRTFSSSPVFRIGGDEFMAILEKSAYEQRDALVRQYQENAEQANRTAREPWEMINMAYGLAVYEKETDHDFADVLKRADAEMYANKRNYKLSRGEQAPDSQ